MLLFPKHTNRILFNFIFCCLLSVLFTLESHGQIAVNGRKTIPITDGPKLTISKRKKVKALKRSQKLNSEQRGSISTNFKGVSKYRGTIAKNNYKKKKNRASTFRGNNKIARNGKKKNVTASFSGNIKAKSRGRNAYASAGKFRGNIKARRNNRRVSLNKLRTAYVKVPPLKQRGNPSIRKYSGNIKVRKNGRFSNSGSNYKGDIKIKKNRIASRKQSRYNGGPVNSLDRAKYRNQLINNSRRKPGQYGKRPKKRNRKKQKLRYDTRESTIWNN